MTVATTTVITFQTTVMRHFKIILTVILISCSFFKSNASQILVPMDAENQENHLKAKAEFEKNSLKIDSIVKSTEWGSDFSAEKEKINTTIHESISFYNEKLIMEGPPL